MKLYEFTFQDNTNLTESELLAVVQGDLKAEADLQGWDSGYNLRQCQNPIQVAKGKTEYHFEVEGD